MLANPLLKFRRAFLFLCLLTLVSPAQAAKFVLSPVLLNLQPAQGLTTSTTITNTDTVPAEFTAEVLLWTQKDGKEVLVPTRDAVVSPMNFKVAPGRSQVVRVALRRPPTAASVTFRLMIRQQVQPAAAGSSSVTITPRYVFSLPLFAEKAGAQPNVALSAVQRDGATYLVFNNTGNGYGVFRNIRLSGGGQSAELGNQYVLSGSTMELKLPPTLTGARVLEFSAEDVGQKPTRATLNVP
ncbi:fimbrial biogenesis chaperone [Deinococcus marmoris]|uniref:Sigma-fimbriae chaperone protein n=1 Tax=Deinococcus marmoris TaxID=249408 RepID=A0A1U7P0D1_9DEIO|nr:fimbria/pilus periplasmic chaperone [Deinococcus marmoris]OLV18632.1 Sigma-fimbriae chaperone protein [Deinococcus marmoris]